MLHCFASWLLEGSWSDELLGPYLILGLRSSGDLGLSRGVVVTRTWDIVFNFMAIENLVVALTGLSHIESDVFAGEHLVVLCSQLFHPLISAVLNII